MANIHQSGLSRSIIDAFHSAKYTDLTVSCASDEYKVHRLVVCQRSKFFAAACDDGFKESQEGLIKLDDEDPDAVRRMLTYLYELDYIDGEAWSTPPEESGKSSSTSSPRLPIIHPSTVTEHPPYADQEDVDAQLVLSLDDKERLASIHERMMNNVMVYAIADKYDIPELKDLAKEKFHGQIEEVWPHEDLSSVVKAVYQTTPTGDMGLRQIIIDACSAHFEDIVKDEAIMETLMETADLATGLLVKSVQHLTLAKAQQELVQLKLGTSLEQSPFTRSVWVRYDSTDEMQEVSYETQYLMYD